MKGSIAQNNQQGGERDGFSRIPNPELATYSNRRLDDSFHISTMCKCEIGVLLQCISENPTLLTHSKRVISVIPELRKT